MVAIKRAGSGDWVGSLPALALTVGIEPTVFLMSLIYSQLPSPLGTQLHISLHTLATLFDAIQSRERECIY